MPKIYVLVGVPGSGKSTFAKLNKSSLNAEIVSSDVVRNMHPDWPEEQIFPEVYRLTSEYLKKEINVIYDATSISPLVRKRLVNELEKYNVKYQMEAYYFPISYEDCLARIAKRNENPQERFFPLDALKSYCERIVAPSLEEGFLDVHVIDQTKLNDVSSKLLKDLVVNNNQGYAFFYQDERGTVSSYQGRLADYNSPKISIDTNFRLASVSKQFIAYSIYSLIKMNKLSYDTKINDVLYLGEYAKDITIKNLLNHTSGLPDYENMEHSDAQIKDIDVLNYLRGVDKLKFAPSTQYAYSNSGFVLLGLVIEQITKEKVNDYIEKNIFSKLEMNSSKVNIQGVTKIDNRAYGHVIENGVLTVKDQYWCSATIGDGGLYSSVNDLIKWLDYLTLLYKEGQNKEFFESNVLETNENTEYALGIRHIVRKGLDIVCHCGATIGTNTVIGIVPSQNKKFIFLTNLDDIDCKKLIDNLISIL